MVKEETDRSAANARNLQKSELYQISWKCVPVMSSLKSFSFVATDAKKMTETGVEIEASWFLFGTQVS